MYTNNKILTQNNTKIEKVCKVLIIDYEKELHIFARIKKIRQSFWTINLPIIVFIEEKNKKIIPMLIEVGIDDFLVKPIDQEKLQLRIKLALARTTLYTTVNPLTKLPGNERINNEIRKRLSGPIAILYIDIDHFKAFNDRYGYIRGDAVLIQTATLLTKNIGHDDSSCDFVGNIGGDDFVIITTPERALPLAETVCTAFDAQAPFFYSKEDQSYGSVTTHNRRGNPTAYPFLSLSIAIVHNQLRRLTTLAQVSELAAELKRYAKSKPNGETGSNVVTDRRRDF